MKKLTLLCLVLTVLSCSNQTHDSIFAIDKVKSGPLVVSVDGTEIHQGFLDLLGELNPRLSAQLSNPLTRKKILSSLVDQQLLYDEALKRNISNQQDVIVKSLLNKHVIISNALIETELEKAMEKSYNEKKAEQFTKLKVALIAALFDPSETAKPDATFTEAQKKNALDKINKIKSRLDKGDDFATVAKEDSDDNKTRGKGGDAGQIAKNDRRFARLGYEKLTEAAFKLKKDQHSDPIETNTGLFIIKAISDPEIVPLEEAKRALRFELQNKIKDDLVSSLRKKAKIQYANAEDAKIPAVTDGGQQSQEQLNSKQMFEKFKKLHNHGQEQQKKDQKQK
ncbi:MAG: peptidylprolyl isomerase [Deltaproteobacteria bacterium]|nr:peptidylprolyl isomerase [Deltaproteobacteria bacterium]